MRDYIKGLLQRDVPSLKLFRLLPSGSVASSTAQILRSMNAKVGFFSFNFSIPNLQSFALMRQRIKGPTPSIRLLSESSKWFEKSRLYETLVEIQSTQSIHSPQYTDLILLRTVSKDKDPIHRAGFIIY